MMNVIKTAIITIIISIISGLLLEHFKNLAPRILCDVGNGVPTKLGDKKVYAYIITVESLSKKIIHKLSLNVQSSKSNLKIADAKITKGLKFESSLKDNILDIDIPFLSKGDKFSIKVYVESNNKPVIVMRSPENFKRVDSIEQNGIVSTLFNESKNNEIGRVENKDKARVPDKNDDFTMIMNKPLSGKKVINKNKKIIIAVTSIVLLVAAAALVKFCFRGAPTKAQTSTATTDTSKSSTSSAQSSNGTNQKPSAKASSGKATRNAGARTSTSRTNENTGSSTSTSGTSGNSNTKTSTGSSSGNTQTNTSTGGASGNTQTNTSTGNSTGNTETKTPAGGTSGNSETKASTGNSTGNTSENQSANGTNQNAGK